jgi:transposase
VFFSIGNQYGTWIKRELRQIHPRYFKEREIGVDDNTDIRPKAIKKLREECKEYWAKLFWSIADAKPTEFNEVRKIEIFEFFRLLKIHEERQIQTLKNIKKNAE